MESGQAFLDLGCGGGHLIRDILRWQLEIMATPLLYRYYGIVDASRADSEDRSGFVSVPVLTTAIAV